MTPTPLAELFAAVPGLDDAGLPVSFRVKGDAIVARWNIPRAASLYPRLDLSELDRRFAVTVTFDEGSGCFALARPEPGGSEADVDGPFDPSRMTVPLRAFLAEHGWRPTG